MSQVLRVDAHDPDPAVIAAAAEVLLGGGLVAFPTETVYGLGADALDAGAVARVFAAKGRPADDPVIVHVLGAADLPSVASYVPPIAEALADAFWPGPLTLVVPRGRSVPAMVAAGLDTVAVRAPSHPVARALIAAVGRPIAAPSANPFGRTSPTTAAHVVADLGSRVDLVLDGGPSDVGVESTVVDCRSDPPVVLRPGGIPLEALAPWGVRGLDDPGGPRRSPGTLERHYAPRTRLVLLVGRPGDVRSAMAAAVELLVASGRRIGLLLADEDAEALSSAPVRPEVEMATLGPEGDDVQIAHGLFAALHDLDARGVDAILAREFGSGGLALAVRDRLARASQGRVVTVAPGQDREAAEAAARAAVPESR